MPKRNQAHADGAGGERPAKRIRGPKFTKTLGQHILQNPLAIKSIVEKANVKPSDTVLEVGAGTGNLTVKLLEKSKKVIAIEKDPRLAAELTKRLQETPLKQKLQLIVGDVLATDLPYFDICVSNTPYQISSPLLFKLLAHEPPPRSLVLMFQREFALRCVAQTGDDHYSRLTVNCNMYGRPKHIMKLSSRCFVPPPQVDSSVLRIEPTYPRPRIPFSEWDGFVRLLFNRKHRELRKIFKDKSTLRILMDNIKVWRSRNCRMDAEDADDDVEMQVDPDVEVLIAKCLEGMEDKRVITLGQEALLELLLRFNSRGIHFAS